MMAATSPLKPSAMVADACDAFEQSGATGAIHAYGLPSSEDPRAAGGIDVPRTPGRAISAAPMVERGARHGRCPRTRSRRDEVTGA